VHCRRFRGRAAFSPSDIAGLSSARKLAKIDQSCNDFKGFVILGFSPSIRFHQLSARFAALTASDKPVESREPATILLLEVYSPAHSCEI
jgi:hypothetical protein